MKENQVKVGGRISVILLDKKLTSLFGLVQQKILVLFPLSSGFQNYLSNRDNGEMGAAGLIILSRALEVSA